MPDLKLFRKKLFLRALMSAQSMGPLTVGLVALLAMFFLSIKSAALFLGGIVGLIGGAAWGLKRYLWPSDKMEKAIIAEIAREREVAEEERLNVLQNRLQSDGDSRTDTLLMDLRTLIKGFRDERQRIGVAADTAFIFDGAERLFDRCVIELERSLLLHEQMLAIRDRDLRAQAAGKRDAVIKEIKLSLQRIADMHVKVQQLQLEAQHSGESLKALRDEFDSNLEIMRQVDAELAGSTRTTDFAQYAVENGTNDTGDKT